MTEYICSFYTTISAKSKKDLERKAEKIETAMTFAIGKKVHRHGWIDKKELENQISKED